MLKSKVQVAEVGDVIRALDFAGQYDCYMIGVVTEVQNEVIKCRGISRVWDGKSEKFDQPFSTVQEGAMMFDARYPGRISVLCGTEAVDQ